MRKLGSCLALAVLLLGPRAAWADEGCTADSFAQWRAQAETGDAVAQYSAGWCLQMGSGVEKDLGGAERWYRLAADQGHTGAQHNLAHVLGLLGQVEEALELQEGVVELTLPDHPQVGHRRTQLETLRAQAGETQ